MTTVRDADTKHVCHRWYKDSYQPPGRCLDPAGDPVLVAKTQERLDHIFRPELMKPVKAPWYTRLWRWLDKKTDMNRS